MVNSEEDSLVTWAPGGDSFVILDADKFAQVCLSYTRMTRQMQRSRLSSMHPTHFVIVQRRCSSYSAFPLHIDLSTKVLENYKVYFICSTAKLLW